MLLLSKLAASNLPDRSSSRFQMRGPLSLDGVVGGGRLNQGAIGTWAGFAGTRDVNLLAHSPLLALCGRSQEKNRMLTLNPATMHAEAPHSKTKVLLAINEISRAC